MEALDQADLIAKLRDLENRVTSLERGQESNDKWIGSIINRKEKRGVDTVLKFLEDNGDIIIYAGIFILFNLYSWEILK